jgi:hypothetical protein
MPLEGGDEQDEVAVGEAVGEVELIVAAEDEVEVEAFGRHCCEVAHEAGVGFVVDLTAQLLILLQHLPPYRTDVAHL